MPPLHVGINPGARAQVARIAFNAEHRRANEQARPILSFNRAAATPVL